MMFYSAVSSSSKSRSGINSMVCRSLEFLEMLEILNFTGPIIRIIPWEVHISDPEFYDALYSTKSHFNEIEAWKHHFGFPLSIFDTIQHDHHHRRRGALNLVFHDRKSLNSVCISNVVRKRSATSCRTIIAEGAKSCA